MPEGLSPIEVAKEIDHHRKHGGGPDEDDRRLRTIAIVEAVLLSVVTILAAWSGYSAAKWGTESSLTLARAAAARAEANRAFQESLTVRTADASTFNAWFSAYLTGDRNDMRVAEGRFRPGYRRAFTAWLATNPFTNPDAPGGPQEMPQYRPPGLVVARRLDARADARYEHGQSAAESGDKYVRTTVILASVLFLVGISTQFAMRSLRYGLISVGVVLLLVSVVEILSLPRPP
jgi:hypothetical protein